MQIQIQPAMEIRIVDELLPVQMRCDVCPDHIAAVTASVTHLDRNLRGDLIPRERRRIDGTPADRSNQRANQKQFLHIGIALPVDWM